MNRSYFPLILLFIAIVLTACSRQPVYSSPALSGQDAVIDTNTLTPDTPKFYTYRYQGKNINFFVIKMDRKVVSFLDACASCYPHKQGYRSEQDGIVTCRYCNMQFSIYKLEKGLGGCYPIRIEGRIDKDAYRIPLSALQAAADKF